VSARRGASPRWRRAVGADIPALSAFLMAEEERRVGFSGRLIREGPLSGPSLRLPSPLRGAVWICDARGGSGEQGAADLSIMGAILCHPSRLVFPILPLKGPIEGAQEREGDRSFALLCFSFPPASIIGMTEDVARYESALALKPRASVAYRLMTRVDGAPPPLALSVPAYPLPATPGLSIRRATISDLDSLTPLQEAYEREEVLTPVHNFNPAACRASLARAIERQLVFAAVEGGVIVGKAGTNARGFRVDQIGGVYTLPARRGRGVAAALMAALLADILRRGRKPSLFVKPTNAAALALYRGLGFEDIGDYRADYFEA
jgi:ribosomal protein S18 acetylase RimI-like enzyme